MSIPAVVEVRDFGEYEGHRWATLILNDGRALGLVGFSHESLEKGGTIKIAKIGDVAIVCKPIMDDNVMVHFYFDLIGFIRNRDLKLADIDSLQEVVQNYDKVFEQILTLPDEQDPSRYIPENYAKFGESVDSAGVIGCFKTY